MKLYYSPGACALGVQIVLRELGAKFEMVKVDLKAKQSAEGDYKLVNPKGYVPALKLDDGDVLTEHGVIVQWLADQSPEKNLIPKWGTRERYKAMEWLNFVSTELHKGVGSLFNPTFTDEVKASVIAKTQVRLAFLDAHLQKNAFMLGAQFSVVDAYVYNIMRWTIPLKVDLTAHKAILGFIEKMSSRPSVRASVEVEGLKL